MNKKVDFRISSLDGREACEKAIKGGAIAAFISAGITVAFVAAGFFGVLGPELGAPWHPLMLADVVLLIVIAYFVLRRSRVASTLLVVYFIASKAIMWTEMGRPQGSSLVPSIIFLVCYVSADRKSVV